MTNSFDLSRLAAAQDDERRASETVCAVLHALFPPGAPVAWSYRGRRHEGEVIEGSGRQWGGKLPVRMKDGGRIVFANADGILAAAAVRAG